MPLDRYLGRHAEAEARVPLPELPALDRVLVIPARREAPALLSRLDALWQTPGRTAIILVINRPPEEAVDGRLAQAIEARYERLHRDAPLHWYRPGTGQRLLVVDRYSGGRCIPPDRGVGLARKIGCDIACRLIHEGRVASPWIFSSDADVRWPADYFTADAHDPGPSALLFPFTHVGDGTGLAIALYEFSLHYYALGLARAGSPYAYHSLGSALAIDYRHYARVRGFPPRPAGEDFYLLNKLAKSGPITRLSGPTLPIDDRASDRVPFGTGPARQRIAALADPAGQLPLYHPRCFHALGEALAGLATIAREQRQDPGAGWRRWLDGGSADARRAGAMLEDHGIVRALAHAAAHSRSEAGFNRHLATWFDAFRTLKFIHGMRDRHYPSTNLAGVVTGAGFMAELLPGPPPCGSETALAQWLRLCNRRCARALAAPGASRH